MNYKFKFFTAFCLVIMGGELHAEITFNGFASIVAGVTTSSDEALFGYDNSIDFSKGSLFALQVSSDLGEGLSVTAQILARGENDWSPNFEWAYVSYEATDNLRILAGRQRAPFYMYSDFLDVSYAYTWITPPTGVYDLIFDTYDGLGAIYTSNIGEFDTTLQVLYGRNSDDLNAFGENISPDFKDLIGGSFTANRDWLTLRAGYFQAEMNVPHSGINGLAAGWQQAGYPDISTNVYVVEDTGVFMELGFQLDFERFIVVGEFTDLTLDDTPLTDEQSYYVMAGMRFDNILVHLTYGGDENRKNDITSTAPYGIDIPFECAPGIADLKACTQGLVASQITEQTYITLGLRWDFHDSASLKFEYTSFSDDLNSMNDAGLFRTAIVTVF